ncbi:glycosyltransferase [Saccharibacter sp. 17.LH.SD]|uniref:glycosyltransferase family 4 protein n=1 Tax=Saccharibacter sp. 17.LH.SD TaxID=2689393 RepID=UPI001371D2C6|nr:glycosyltransferase family 1 protein [Saccharibacter sp. 17.LH.SD]MXV45174.1 glycosyltransferase [Saccharibacter sp. 17.LH.SD]
MLIGLDTRNTGRGRGTGVATYAATLKNACIATGLQPMMLHDETATAHSAHSLASRIARAIRSTMPSRSLSLKQQGYTCTDLYRTAEVRDRLWESPTLVKSTQSPTIMHWTYPLPMNWPGIPNIVTIHDIIPVLHPKLSGISSNRIIRRLNDWINRADAIVTVSNSVKSDLINCFSVPESKIFMSSQPVSFSNSLLHEASQTPAPCEPGGFIYFGTLESRKNIGRIIDAHSRSKTTRHLTLIGEKGHGSDNELRALVSHRKPETVTIVPWCSLPSLIRAISEARAVVFPSLAEGFGLPIIEAMALQTPVITSRGHATEEISGSAALLVNNTDTNELAYAFNLLDKDDALCMKLQEAGLNRAKDFSFTAYAQRMSLFYRTFL